MEDKDYKFDSLSEEKGVKEAQFRAFIDALDEVMRIGPVIEADKRRLSFYKENNEKDSVEFQEVYVTQRRIYLQSLKDFLIYRYRCALKTSKQEWA